MTARKPLWSLFLMSFVSVAACEEKKEAAPAAAPAAAVAPDAEAKTAEGVKVADANASATTPAKEVVLPGALEVCAQLVEAAKAKDEAKFLALSTPATQTALAAEGIKAHVFGALGAATCGSSKADEQSATVQLSGMEPVQEIAFNKAADGWKFDGAAYLAKYPVTVAKEKVKKAAGKAHQKAKAHDKKHH